MKVALLWNGDKSSALAYGKVRGKFDISFLLTFLQKERSNVKYLSNVKNQSEKLGVPFFWAKMRTSRPEEYQEIIAELKDDYGVEGIVMDEGQGVIEAACRTNGVEVIKA